MKYFIRLSFCTGFLFLYLGQCIGRENIQLIEQTDSYPIDAGLAVMSKNSESIYAYQRLPGESYFSEIYNVSDNGKLKLTAKIKVDKNKYWSNMEEIDKGVDNILSLVRKDKDTKYIKQYDKKIGNLKASIFVERHQDIYYQTKIVLSKADGAKFKEIEYEYGLIRNENIKYLSKKNALIVIVDYCGASSCSSNVFTYKIEE